ncbi:L,D-transpeptidase family protein [Streptomyces sp. NPDC047023]|uniref:L,D-transpeptidase family protein n=1 Tax=Streptomyces sp. NPDC047023 TaxID=3155139 RepID=UPI003408DB97
MKRHLLAAPLAAALVLAPATAVHAVAPAEWLQRAGASLAAGARDLNTGDRGDDVLAVQEALAKLHYYHGALNGLYTEEMVPSVWAFQKVHGLKVRETVGAPMLAALQEPREPEPLLDDGADDRVEIDLTKQLMTIYKAGSPYIISHISSGSGKYYCSEGRCRDATTPTGDFEVYRVVEGWETAPLGEMYRPLYFYGGFALHGSITVPNKPDSHGCIRIPMSLADLVADTVEMGWPVHLRRT